MNLQPKFLQKKLEKYGMFINNYIEINLYVEFEL